MDVCRYCSTPLGFVRRLLGDGLFCCRAHRILFQKECTDLALKTLAGSERPPRERLDEMLPLALGGPSPPPPWQPAAAKSFSIFLRQAHPLSLFRRHWFCGHSPPRPRPGELLPVETGGAVVPETVAILRGAERLDTALPVPRIPGRGVGRRTFELDPARRIADSSIEFRRELGLERPPLSPVWPEVQLEPADWTGAPAPTDALRAAMTLERPNLVRDAPILATPQSHFWGLHIPRLTFHTLRPRVGVGNRPGLAHGLPG